MSRTSPGSSSTSRTSIGWPAGLGVMGVVSSFGNGQGEAEGGAVAGVFVGGHEPDATAVELDDLAAHRQADAGAGELLLGMEALEDHEDPVGVARGDADAVVADREGVGVAAVVGSRVRSHDSRTRGGASPRNLMALANRFCSSAVSSERSPRTCGSGPSMVTLRAGLLDRRAEVGHGVGRDLVHGHDLLLGAHAPDAREREQVVDQHLHALGAVDGELDVLVGALVQLALVAVLEHPGEARDLAQRLLQVVRRDVGELLQLGVGALQVDASAPPAARASG